MRTQIQEMVNRSFSFRVINTDVLCCSLVRVCLCVYESLLGEESEGWRTENVEDTKKQICKRERECVCVCACMTFSNIVILIPCQGLSLGLHQDYSSRPIIT